MDTPCVSVCILNQDSGLCEGCGRTLAEIAGWARMTAEQRRAIMAELPARKAERIAATEPL